MAKKTDDYEQKSGVTASERYLARLGRSSFLNLWCYLNVFTDEGKRGPADQGKELCDMLVVFKDHVIIFSDKDIGFKDTGDLSVDWSRWVRRAVLKSASQVYGAEKFIRIYPNRIFVDRKCETKFPISLAPSDHLRIHRVLVARNATARFRAYRAGSGSLILDPRIAGKEMESTPFHVGTVNPNKGFIHIFDDVALDVLMGELDTISDFVTYLDAKESFISSGKLARSAGEQELLAFFYSSSDEDHDPSFPLDLPAPVEIVEGLYEELRLLPQYSRGKIRDRQSYFIDKFIEHVGQFARTGDWHYSNTTGFEDSTRALRELAAETRIARRVLANGILEKIESTKPGDLGVRVLLSPTSGNTIYVFLIVPIPAQAESYEQYREYRAFLLSAYCRAAKLKFRERDIVVGIAIDPPGNGGSEDVIFMDTTTWTDLEFSEAAELRIELDLLAEHRIVQSSGREFQFPLI